MSRGKWKQPQEDQLEVELVPMTDEVQAVRWYESWAILDAIMTRMDESTAAAAAEKITEEIEWNSTTTS